MKAIENRVEKRSLDTITNQLLLCLQKNFLNEEAIYELRKTVEMKNKLNIDVLIYKAGEEKG